MNKQKFIDYIIKKRFLRQTPLKQIMFKKINSTNKNLLNVITNQNELNEYVYPLNSFFSDFFIIKPYININIKKFSTNVDIVIIDTKYQIVDTFQNTYKIDSLPKEYLKYSKIILAPGNINHLGLFIGEKIKFRRPLIIK
ncbi:MAG: hypothetical protein ACRC4L_04135 [Mycoplasma sp.]